MRIPRTFIIGLVLAALLLPMSVQAKASEVSVHSVPGVTCSFPDSDAEGLVILSNYYPGYWWDHTDLTIAVQAHPKAAEEQVAIVFAGPPNKAFSETRLSRAPLRSSSGMPFHANSGLTSITTLKINKNSASS